MSNSDAETRRKNQRLSDCFLRACASRKTPAALDGFLREMKTRFPDATAKATLPPELKAAPVPTGSLPEIVGLKRVNAAR